MQFERINTIRTGDHTIPAFLFTPDSPHAGAVVIPPYGSTKESMFGLGAALAEHGMAALCIEVCGHGENTTPIGPEMRDEVEAGLGYVRRFGPTVATGVSLGGRLSLMSSADYIVAISPSVVSEISPQGMWMFENFPSPAVREPYSGYVVELLKQLGPVPTHSRPTLLLYAERDIPMILEGAAGLKAQLPGSEVQYVTEEIRPDIKHDNGFIRYLPRWFNHVELKFNNQAIAITTGWLAKHVAQARSKSA